MKDIIQKAREAAPAIFEQTPVKFAYVYGSYARGLSHRFSDLDIGVFVESADIKKSLDLELSLSLCFDEALNHTVQSEVRILNQLPLSVVGSILLDAESIYSEDEELRIEFETNVRKAYYDFLPTIHLHQNACRERNLTG
jgi:predicted nucleotidyltransferase